MDFTVEVDAVGIPDKIISGTTQLTNSPDRLLLAKMTAQFCEAAGLFHDRFSFQTWAGGTSLSISQYFGETLKNKGFSCSFAQGGSNRYLTKMLESHLIEYLLDMQSFDLDGVR